MTTFSSTLVLHPRSPPSFYPLLLIRFHYLLDVIYCCFYPYCCIFYTITPELTQNHTIISRQFSAQWAVSRIERQQFSVQWAVSRIERRQFSVQWAVSRIENRRGFKLGTQFSGQCLGLKSWRGIALDTQFRGQCLGLKCWGGIEPGCHFSGQCLGFKGWRGIKLGTQFSGQCLGLKGDNFPFSEQCL